MQFSKKPVHFVRFLCVGVNALLDFGVRARRGIRAVATLERFGGHGARFRFDPDATYSYESIFVGHNVNLGAGPTLLATRAKIKIGSNVIFGPGVTVRGGNHRFDIVGKAICDITDEMKRPEDDLGVIIEDDVWVGGGATILHGVTIGRGSVVGGSAVVTKSLPRRYELGKLLRLGPRFK